MTDPEITEAEMSAIRELTRRLTPVTTIQDPHAFAERFIQDLRAEGWKPPLKPAPAWKTGAAPIAEPNADWKAARAALNRDDEGTNS